MNSGNGLIVQRKRALPVSNQTFKLITFILVLVSVAPKYF
jgi:hypothetical protein